MIRVVLFDLGLTLVDSRNQPFPHVKEALTTLQSFTTAGGTKLLTGLVSDFDMPVPPPTRVKVTAIFNRYLTLLDATGLRPFFEPVERRVTLSTQAGALKPDRKIFATALARLGSKADVADCLFITENAEHIRVVHATLHMQTLQFRNNASAQCDFDDWLQAPSMVAHLIGSQSASNAEAALRDHLTLAHGFDVQAIEAAKRGTATAVRGTLWRAVGKSAGDELADVQVPFAVEGEVTHGPAGEIRAVRLAAPGSTDVAEAANLVRSLARHGQIRGFGSQPADAATHEIETDDRGRRKLVRRRFRAM